MTKSPYRLPKGALTDSGKVLLKMRHAEGVPIKQLSRDFNVSRRIIKKYLNEKKSSGEYTLSPVGGGICLFYQVTHLLQVRRT